MNRNESCGCFILWWLLLFGAYIVDKRKSVFVSFIDVVLLAAYLCPILVGREERVGLFGSVVNLREAQSVGNGQRLFIDTRATDHVHVFVGSTVFYSFAERTKNLAAGEICLATAEHYVATVG